MKNVQSFTIENTVQFLNGTVSDKKTKNVVLNTNLKKLEPKLLLLKVSKGDQDAVNKCIAKYGDLIWNLARKFNHLSSEGIEKAVQEVFLDIWKYAGRYDSTKWTEKDFILLIARQRLIRFLAENNYKVQTIENKH